MAVEVGQPRINPSIARRSRNDVPVALLHLGKLLSGISMHSFFLGLDAFMVEDYN